MRQVLLCALLLASPAVPAAPQAAPQPLRDPMRFLNVQEWHGEAAVVVEGKKGTDAVDHRFATKFRIEMPVGLRATTEGMKTAQKQAPGSIPPQMAEAFKKLLAEILWTPARGKMEETYEVTVNDSSGEQSVTAGPISKTRDATAILKIDFPAGTYDLKLTTSDPVEMTSTSRGKSTKATKRAVPDFVEVKKQPLPTDKDVLTGRIPINAASLPGVSMDAGSLTAWFEWTLSPDPLPLLELDVTIPGYDKWLPEGTEDGLGVGNTLEVTAELRAKGGAALKEKCVKIAFYLVEISTEPGSAMNAPADGGRDYDLRFDAAHNPGLKIDPQGNRASTTTPGVQATAKISCLDFGAWGVLQVYAHTDLGRYVEGTMALLPGETKIRLPKRDKNSKIADAWKTGPAATQADDDDSDSQPPGDGKPGDGFTLYEEYRGFFVGGKHVRTDPDKKDLFVLTRSNHAKIKDGVKMFKDATGLEVHLDDKETLLKDRQANYNFSRTGFKGAQHGIVILGFNPALKGLAYTRHLAGAGEGAGTPKDIQQIEIASDLANRSPRSATWSGSTVTGPDVVASSVAHELCHSVNIPHHGDDWDYEAVWKVRRVGAPNNFVVTEVANGVEKQITVIREDGKPYPWTKEMDMPVAIGVLGGVDSGPWDCLMRYDNANAYVYSKDRSVRVDVHTDEVGGTRLCTDAKGTGPNAATRDPYVRFGDARNGNCAGRIHVKDW